MRKALVLLVGASAMGCAPEDPNGDATGQHGNAFAAVQTYPDAYGLECFTEACGLQWPLMVGTKETVAFTALRTERLPLVHASTTSPDVVDVARTLKTFCQESSGSSSEAEGDHYSECLARGGQPQYGQIFEVTALSPGDTTLTLTTYDGGIFEEFAIAAHPAKRLELQVASYYEGSEGSSLVSGNRYSTVSPLELTGDHELVRVIAFDANGQRLLANRGIGMTVTPGMASFWGESSSTEGFFAELWPLARGSFTLEAHAPSATMSVPVVSK